MAPSYVGGNGGSGVCVVRFVGRDPSVSAGLTYTTATSGNTRIFTFKSGSGTITWS
jgi:hypothetical protein